MSNPTNPQPGSGPRRIQFHDGMYARMIRKIEHSGMPGFLKRILTQGLRLLARFHRWIMPKLMLAAQALKRGLAAAAGTIREIIAGIKWLIRKVVEVVRLYPRTTAGLIVGILLSALVAVALNAFFNGVSAKTAEADAATAAASATH